MTVIAFAASNSKQSINKHLATYAVGLLENVNSEVLDLNDYELPIFSEDLEKEIGQPESAKAFLAKIAASDVVIISFAEHNGSYSAVYKNLFDWCSRITPKVYKDKQVVFLSTSPGSSGAASVLAAATASAPYFGADVKASLSVPRFYDNFDVESGQITNNDIREQLVEALDKIAI